MTIAPSELAKILRFDEATQRLVWLNRKFGAQRAGKHPCRVTGSGYHNITIFRRHYREHRVIWALVHGEWPDEIDHIDGDRKNNCLSNLRNVSRRENSRNLVRRVDNSSGVTGVDWLEANLKWRARIHIDNRTRQIGLYATLEEAKAARLEANARCGFHPNHGRDPVEMSA